LLDNCLSLTAAISRNERTNYRVTDPGNRNPSGQQTLDGSARVDALILGVSGLITDDWSIFANYTFLDSEVLQGASDFITEQGGDYTRGDPLLNVPRNAASLWTTWDAMEGLQLGYASPGRTRCTPGSTPHRPAPSRQAHSCRRPRATSCTGPWPRIASTATSRCS
jgi:catecholate siderophore receptor